MQTYARWPAAALLGARGRWLLPAVGIGRHASTPPATACCPTPSAINSLWVIVAGCLVMFMQAGFAFLEIGFSRGKNAGTVVAKILTNFSIAGDHVLGGRLRLRLRRTGDIIGHDGFFLRDYGDPQKAFPVMGLSDATIESKWFFQFVFCAVSLAIVWGTTLERIKFGVYIIYAIVFAALIYPIGSHWVFGGGWLQSQPRHAGLRRLDGGPPDRRHRRARGAAAARPAARQVRPGRQAAGDPRAQHAAVRPRRADPVARLVRVQPGLDAQRARRPLHRGRCSSRSSRPAAGVLGAIITAALEDEDDRHRHGRQRRDRARSSPSPPRRATSSRGPAPIIGVVAGVIVPLGVYAIDKKLDDPVGALSAHGLAGIWGTLSCGLFTAPRAGRVQRGSATRGLVYTGSFHQLGVQALGVVVVFAFVFVALLRHVLGRSRRPTACASRAEEEDAGLDISEHGMYGYPEQFIPAPELVGYGAARTRLARRRRAPAARPRRRCRHEEGRGVHPPRGVRADPHGAARARASPR